MKKNGNQWFRYDKDLNIVKMPDREARNIKRDNIWLAKVIVFLSLIFSLLFISRINTFKDDISSLEDEVCEYKSLYESTLEEYKLHTLIGELTVENRRCEAIDDSTLWSFVNECSPWYPDIIMAQAVQESSAGRSNLFHRSNNLFGMKKAQRRKTTQIPGVDCSGYGKYKSWKLSVIDRVLWELDYFGQEKPTRDDYMRALGRYAEAEDYIDSIEKISKRYILE